METILNPSLASELLNLGEMDQQMRLKVASGELAWDSSVDEKNSDRLQEILDIHGWPTIPMVGELASNSAWLIAQHAPSLDFMKTCLRLMQALPKKEVNPANIAYLEDRISMLEGKPQLYGTQFVGSGKNLKVYKIKDPDQVDERRASVGLGTFAENQARINKFNAKSKLRDPKINRK